MNNSKIRQIIWLLLFCLGWIHFFTGNTKAQTYPRLPVPQSFELTHVQTKYFTAALKNDPQKIFRYVRDQIGYEVYPGCLRGPRGTLLALAGNSVDQASLLAKMLETAGQKVRFVRGKLLAAKAEELVRSMWAKRPRPKLAEKKPPTDALKKALDTFTSGVKRDYGLIRKLLKKAGIKPSDDAAPRWETLIGEAQDHWWVQWKNGNKWVDLDPSFPGAFTGRVFAKIKTPMARLPANAFHRVEMRIHVEEYTGAKRSERVVLEAKWNAAELSGVDVALTHQPENWKGPARSLQGAIAAAIANTGRFKPVLVIDNRAWKAGKAFWEKPPSRRGLGGISNLLGGRRPVAIATAEWIEFSFVSPQGEKQLVIRELFDRIGLGRRASGTKLTSQEVRKYVQTESNSKIQEALFSLFFTNGHVNANHLVGANRNTLKNTKATQITLQMRRLLTALAAGGDGITLDLARRDGTFRLYPKSPRVYIAALSRSRPDILRFSIDLRHDVARCVVLPDHRSKAFFAQIARGVIQGTLERTLVELFIPKKQTAVQLKLTPTLSTSAVFENAERKRIKVLLLTSEKHNYYSKLPANIRPRLQTAWNNNLLVLVPSQLVLLGKTRHLAWWQIDPRTGETIAVTEDGLHGTNALEYHVETTDNEDEYVVSQYVNRQFISSQRMSGSKLGPYVFQLLERGYTSILGIGLA